MAKFKSIAHIKDIDLGHEFKSPLMNSIVEKVGCRDNATQFTFRFMEDGEFVERVVRSFHTYPQYLPWATRRFGTCDMMSPVIIQYKDGTEEYALKETYKRKIYKKPKLVSAYIHDGLWHDKMNKWVNPQSVYCDSYPIPAVMEKMSRWNERVEHAMINEDDPTIEGRTGCSYELLKTMSWWMLKDSRGRGTGCIEYDTKNPDPFWKVRVERRRYHGAPKQNHLWDSYPPVFMTMIRRRYLKSFYRDVVEEKQAIRLHHIDDLLNVEIGGRYQEEEPLEVWNSLDATIHEGVYE